MQCNFAVYTRTGVNKVAAQLEYVPEGMHSYMCNLPKKYLLPLHCIALKDSCVQCGVSVL